MSGQTSVTVRILDKEYQFACAEEERMALLQSADYLNEKMQEIRTGGKVIGLDRMAVMAALNIANELLQDRTGAENMAEDVTARITSLNAQIDSIVDQDGSFDF
ncbi:MAG: cell division protein ZapA [Gammaproteobacteria bacterium]